MSLRTWALSMLTLDRADQAASYQQFIATLREKARQVPFYFFPFLADRRSIAGQWVLAGLWLVEWEAR
jgi:hypothetical protein